MFNEELDLGESVEEKEGAERRDGSGGSRKTDGHLIGQVKQEVQDGVKTEATQYPAPQPGIITSSSRAPGPPGAPGGPDAAGSSQPGSSGLLSKVGPSLIYY